MGEVSSLDELEVTRLSDYQKPNFSVAEIYLTFDLSESDTIVCSKMKLYRNKQVAEKLVLDFERAMQLFLGEFKLNGQYIDAKKMGVDVELGKIFIDIPLELKEFELVTKCAIDPEANKSCEGLYISGDNFCTQCEAEGFRRITPFIDRPDILAKYTTKIVADAERYPVLLGNGNLIQSGQLSEDPTKHFAVYEDPFPKPSYLFALVAGDLDYIQDVFTTASKKEVVLRIYVRSADVERCNHAMVSLKKSMKWDEEKYGREYDLKLFNIVAVNDFNAGAMENKSLNIFNSKYILASLDSATDNEFQQIESVVAHEYFHNWTGNRVTCRDWFQLTLKEGLTVFRDQQFSADMGSQAVCRIKDVQSLRARQFPEDASPLAHPPRPSSYSEISNFYTATVYEKGAELIRMLFSILGEAGFRKGTDLYFERYDGQAVTCEDWLQTMADANPSIHLDQFKLWYTEPGTPIVQIESNYDAEAQILELHMKQGEVTSPGHQSRLPKQIPVSLGFVGVNGEQIPFTYAGQVNLIETVVLLEKSEQTFSFDQIPAGSVPSLLRNFSAPVILKHLNQDQASLLHLFKYDSDSFNRWEAGQQLVCEAILTSVYHPGSEGLATDEFVAAYTQLLEDQHLEPQLKATFLAFPPVATLVEQMEDADPPALHAARHHFMKNIAKKIESVLAKVVSAHEVVAENMSHDSIGKRALYNSSLRLLATLEDEALLAKIADRVSGSKMMTDSLAALQIIACSGFNDKQMVLEDFYRKWSDNFLVTNNWLGIQASAPDFEGVKKIPTLMQHPSYIEDNPNCAYAVLGGFSRENHLGFHNPELAGAGYRFLSDTIRKIDQKNPHVSARLANVFAGWRKYKPSIRESMQQVLVDLKQSARLSKDLTEIVVKSLGS